MVAGMMITTGQTRTATMNGLRLPLDRRIWNDVRSKRGFLPPKKVYICVCIYIYIYIFYNSWTVGSGWNKVFFERRILMFATIETFLHVIFVSESHSDASDQEREWEEQQIRKGVSIPAQQVIIRCSNCWFNDRFVGVYW